MTVAPTRSRKAEHLEINLHADVAAKGVETGLRRYTLQHCALPEIDLAGVDLRVRVLGFDLGAPLFVSCMTGGTPEAEPVNAALATAAEELGLMLGTGSARVLLEHPEARWGFDVRRHAPHVPLLANLGAVQLNRGVTPDDCARLVETLAADVLVLHCNPLQEALQREGDTDFRGLLARIRSLCAVIGVPVVVKEVGWGLAPDVVEALLDDGVAGVDVAGAGGTSWSEVERHRLGDGAAARVAAAFAGWGIPTADALAAARAAVDARGAGAAVLASGGIRGGLDVALALALGADAVGAAGVLLRAAADGPEAVIALAREWLEVLRIAMFVTGCASVAALQRTPRLLRDGVAVRVATAP